MKSRPPWPQAFLDALAADPRVVGAAELAASAPGTCRVRIVTTWDGLEPLGRDAARWRALAGDGAGRRVEIAFVRISDLLPAAEGVDAVPVVDPKGLVEQWARWSVGRPEGGAADAPAWDGAGTRVVAAAGRDPAVVYDDFLRAADAEGFLGDRVLFDAASARLSELSRRAPAFDEGFVVPTFDLVEARWAFGAAVGGCKLPLVPAVHVGVGVTPADALEFWAAPAVRDAACTVACVADAGARTVVLRTAGKDALLAALLDAVDDAWEKLPDLLRAARRAGRMPADADTEWKPLHLPKSFLSAARRRLSAGVPVTRLAAALALARAGSGAPPLVARKLALAAGRLLASTPGSPDATSPAC